MSSVYSIFDFFKEAFRINKSNKVLYKPQIALIALKVLMILLFGISVYYFVGNPSKVDSIGSKIDNYFSGTFGLLIFFEVIAAIVFLRFLYDLFISFFEAGIYNMYKKAVDDGNTVLGDFSIGVGRYFLRFLFGNVLIDIAIVLLLIPFGIIGVVTLGIGISVLPLLGSIFLTMWKVSVVMNDTGVIEAFKDSFRFAKKNFYQLALLQIINWSFTQPVSGGGSGNFNRLSDIKDIMNENQNNSTPPNKFDTNPYYRNQSFGDDSQSPFGSSDSSNPLGNGDVVNPFDRGNNGNPFNAGNDLSPFGNIPNQEQIADSVMKGIKIGIAVLIPVLTIATAVGAAIKAVFEIFFSLALFVAYKSEVRDENEPKREVFF